MTADQTSLEAHNDKRKLTHELREEHAKFTPKSAPVHEARFIAAILEDAYTLDRLNASRSIPLEAFEDYKHRQVWKRLREAKSRDEVESIALPYAVTNTEGGMLYLNDVKALRLHALEVMGLDRVREWMETLPITGINGDPLTALEARRLDLSTPPERLPAVMTCSGVPVACNGDVTAILAPAKSGKSALCGAFIAAAVVSGEGITTENDCLGIAAGIRPDNGVVLLFDTEQSQPDQFDLAQRAARRAGVEKLPDWVMPYNLVGATPAEIRAMLTAKVSNMKAGGVPVWFVVIDGIADLCDDPNDLRESQDLVREVHGHARDSDCPILAVIHRNEGRDADASARGHLGKQLARKAAFNLTLEKDSDEVTVVFSTKNRGAPIMKESGPRFAWCNEAKMHVSVGSKSTLRGDEKTQELRRVAEEVFGANRLRYSEACERIEKARRVKDKAAEKWFTTMKKAHVIKESGMGYWMLVAA
jgi:hypothetical protein